MPRLTRSQVAQRLGRSIATVRRLEDDGILKPTLGLRRIRYFQSADVDDLARHVRATGRTLASTCAFGHRETVPLDHERGLRATELVEAIVELLEIVRPRNARALALADAILELLCRTEP
jgi:DNA-binding transcriptional MerR regulator